MIEKWNLISNANEKRSSGKGARWESQRCRNGRLVQDEVESVQSERRRGEKEINECGVFRKRNLIKTTSKLAQQSDYKTPL